MASMSNSKVATMVILSVTVLGAASAFVPPTSLSNSCAATGSTSSGDQCDAPKARESTALNSLSLESVAGAIGDIFTRELAYSYFLSGYREECRSIFDIGFGVVARRASHVVAGMLAGCATISWGRDG